MKKFLSLVLALVMALSLTTVAFGVTVADGAGLQAAVADGATITLPAGDFVMGNYLDLSAVPAGGSITIEGNGTTVNPSTVWGQKVGFMIRNANDITVTFKNLVFTGAGRGIEFDLGATSDVSLVVVGCTFNNASSGVYLGVTVADATFENTTFDGCAAGIGTESVGDLIVDDCVFEDTCGEAIGWTGTGDLSVENSTVESAIIVYDPAANTDDVSFAGSTFAVAPDAALLDGLTLIPTTNGTLAAAPTVTKGDKFDLYQADDGMATALKLKTPDVPGLSFEEVSAKEYTDGSGNVAYIVANNGQYFVKTTAPYTTSYAVTYAGKTDVLYYVNVGSAGAGYYAYEEEVTAFTNFGAKCGQLNILPVPTALETYFQDSDGKVYKAAAKVGGVAGNNYLLNGEIVTAVGAGQDVIKHAFVFNDFDYNAALKQNVPVKAICTTCLEQTTSIYLKTKVPATYVEQKTTGEGSAYYVVALADGTIPSAPVVVPSTPGKVESAATFDAGIAMYVGMSVMAAAGSAVVIGKKKEF